MGQIIENPLQISTLFASEMGLFNCLGAP